MCVLSVWTKRSSKPLVAGWYGLDLMCLMLFKARNHSDPAEVNWGPIDCHCFVVIFPIQRRWCVIIMSGV